MELNLKLDRFWIQFDLIKKHVSNGRRPFFKLISRILSVCETCVLMFFCLFWKSMVEISSQSTMFNVVHIESVMYAIRLVFTVINDSIKNNKLICHLFLRSNAFIMINLLCLLIRSQNIGHFRRLIAFDKMLKRKFIHLPLPQYKQKLMVVYMQ